MDARIEVPTDPEDGLTETAVAALYTYVLTPDDLSLQYDRMDIVGAWLQWCLEKLESFESLEELVVVQHSDGSIDARLAKPRRRKSHEIVGELSTDFQRSLLECPLPGDEQTRITIATECLTAVLSELNQTQVDEEKLLGHLILVHGAAAVAEGTPTIRRQQHRNLHRARTGYLGHHAIK